MNLTRLTAEIHRRLKAAGTARRREFAARVHPTAMEVLGVPVPKIRAVALDVVRRLEDAPGDEAIRLARALIAGGTFEGRQAAYEILSRHKPAMEALTTRSVEGLGRGMDGWGSVDGFACLVAGPAWREGQVGDAAVKRWARSRDPWWRRAALVSTVALNQKSRGGRGDTPRTLEICRILRADGDGMVAKALSWALRALIARDRGSVRKFLRDHEAVLPRRVLREVGNKLRTGLKTPHG